MVGILASCQPMPVLITSTPQDSSSLANAAISLQSLPPFIKSSILNLNMITKSSPTASLVCRTISKGNFIRFSKLPPHSSVLWFVSAAMN